MPRTEYGEIKQLKILCVVEKLTELFPAWRKNGRAG